MKTDWGYADLRNLHDRGFHYLREGDTYGTFSVVTWKYYNQFVSVQGGFKTKQDAQAFIDGVNPQSPLDMEIQYIQSLEEELAAYMAGLQAGVVPHYSLAQLVDFRDRPETLALAIQDIQDKISFLEPEPLVREWLEYQRSLGKED